MSLPVHIAKPNKTAVKVGKLKCSKPLTEIDEKTKSKQYNKESKIGMQEDGAVEKMNWGLKIVSKCFHQSNQAKNLELISNSFKTHECTLNHAHKTP